jgi:N-acetylglucosamine kinase-like BadF-type ATPase
MNQSFPAKDGLLALGIDAGGTQTRWALAAPTGEILAEGHLPGFSALELQGAGRDRVVALLADLARAVRVAGQPARVHAALTGLGAADPDLAQLVAGPLGLPPEAVTMSSDLETMYLDLFAPGQGYVVYAGTGSVAAFIDVDGTLHRAGGRGGILDDGGGGFWIARQALRQVWRGEDERPGAWRESPMAGELFADIGGSDWADTRRLVYSGSRGEVGRLALAVARAADRDPDARAILAEAGAELARLARALLGRYGPRPVALSGRAATLHPLISAAMQEALPTGTAFSQRPSSGHHAAAFLALRATTGAPHCPEDPHP